MDGDNKAQYPASLQEIKPAIAVRKYVKTGVKVFWFLPIFVDFFSVFFNLSRIVVQNEKDAGF